MDETLLKLAQHGLRITDVALRESRSWLADGYEPKYEQLIVDAQFMQRTVRSEVLEVEDDGHGKHDLFRVFVAFGIRWVTRPQKTRARKRAKKDTEPAEPKVLGLIEATFIAEYEVTESIDKLALDEFALHNVPWNIWPYWREYVASQSSRLNLPKATLPLQCFTPRKPESVEKQ